ncbi:MAG: polyprenyl diphosphate synthase [Gammaproteobacteria bacterium]
MDAPHSGKPRHIAIIMDGNNRWARQRGLPSIEGHRAGAKALRVVVEECVRQGIEALTVFAFSSENWRRPPQEVSGLMELLVQALREEVPSLHEHDIAVRFIGDLASFEPTLQQAMHEAVTLTSANRRLVLNVAVNYGGRWDIARAVQSFANDALNGVTDPSSVTEHTLASYFSLSDLPEVDLYIRTGGEFRLSNFLLWQAAYAELYFSELLWPDFNEATLLAAIAEYAQRQRRFGRTGDQVQALIQSSSTATAQAVDSDAAGDNAC